MRYIRRRRTQLLTRRVTLLTVACNQLILFDHYLLIQEVPNEAPLLRTHDQEMVRSSRIRVAKLLCKQR